jgi:hypothetical protein
VSFLQHTNVQSFYKKQDEWKYACKNRRWAGQVVEISNFMEKKDTWKIKVLLREGLSYWQDFVLDVQGSFGN